MGTLIMNKHALTKSKGFTLIEVVVVIVVIAILAAITTVVYRGVQSNAHDTAVKADLSSFYKNSKVENIFDNSASFTSEYPFSLINRDDISRDCRSDLFANYTNAESYGDPNLKSCKLTESGKAKVERLTGTSPSRASYWQDNSDDIYSLVVSTRENYRSIYENGSYVGWELEVTPLFTGRSKSGKSFVQNGNLHDISNDASYVEYLEGEIAYYEEFIAQYNACVDGGDCVHDWWSEDDTQWWNGDDYGRAWSEEQLTYLRQELDRAKNNRSLAGMLWERPLIFYSAADDSWYIGGEGYWADTDWQGHVDTY